MFGGFDHTIKGNPSQGYLLHIAIGDALKKSNDFDFEGSMNKQIDYFFMSFNPSIIPYHVIESYSNIFSKIYFSIKK